MMSYPTPHTIASVTNRLATNSHPRTSSLRTVFIRCSTSHTWGARSNAWFERVILKIARHSRPGIARSWLSFYESVNFLLPSRCPFPDPSPCPGRGQARLARAGEGSSHAVAYLHSLCTSQTRSLLILHRYSLLCAPGADSVALSAFGAALSPIPVPRQV